MGVLFHCSNCERPLNVGEQFAGQAGMCPNCRETINVPFESEIRAVDFRNLLNVWSKQQKTDSLESGTIDIETASSSGPVSTKQKAAAGTVPVVTLKPINVGGIVTESEKVANGISDKFSAAAPDLMNDSAKAVWFIRPPTGGQFGPASANLLRQWIQEGRVTGDSYVWCEGWDNWQLAADVFPAIASKISTESIATANADAVTAARTRTAYMKARKRRTMWNTIGLVVGSVVVIGLIVALFIVFKNNAG